MTTHANCLYDTCNSEKSEQALCAALSTYARDCSENGQKIIGWRKDICEVICPESMIFSYNLRVCNSTCRLLSQPNALCDLPTALVEGCGCPPETFLNDNDECVEPMRCPCFHNNDVIPAESSINIGEVTCKCIQGVLDCPIGSRANIEKECPAPMYYMDCLSAGPNAVGSECQKSCKTQDMNCYNKECVSGCLCPDGLVSDGQGECIPEKQCPCVHGETFYTSGQTMTILCNTCTCFNRTWTCTSYSCPMTCNVFGNGHYTSFDGAHFDFSSECEYTFTQDFCPNNPGKGTFSITAKNTVCGLSEAICSVSITLILQNTMIILSEGVVKEKHNTRNVMDSYEVNLTGMYIIVKTLHGLTLMWDQKTTVTVQLEAAFQGKVCGICGNFDGQVSNDFTSSYQSLETNEEAFGNSWRLDSSCPGSNSRADPCFKNPFREAWAQKQCSIIKSVVFASCHPKVSPVHYYKACVSDTCSCDAGGDCQCLCTAIAAYATACSEVGTCIHWRSPKVCPVFCDFYNHNGSCIWHYRPCGYPCLRTCTNPLGKCGNQSNHLEGCYPQCSSEKPYYDEDQLKCVSALKCSSCQPGKQLCTENSTDCLCCYNGKIYELHEEVYNISDGLSCKSGVCGPDGLIIHASVPCGTVPTRFPSASLGNVSVMPASSTPTTRLASTTSTSSKPPTSSATTGTSKPLHPRKKTTTGTVSVMPASSAPTTRLAPPATPSSTSTKTPTSSAAAVMIKPLHPRTETTTGTVSVMPASSAPTTRLAPPTSTSSETPTSSAAAGMIKPLHPRTETTTAAVTPTRTAPTSRLAPPASTISTTATPPPSAPHMNDELSVSPAIHKTPGTQLGFDCYIVNNTEIITYNNCTSTYEVAIPFCRGNCGTSAKYSHETGSMTRKCACCHETKTRDVEVVLLCQNSRETKYTYVYVEECACTETECPANKASFP